MAASALLVDSSFYIDALRRGIDPLVALASEAMTRDVAICPVVRCEVGRGIRIAKVRARFKAFWDVMVNVPTDNRLWEEAEQTLWDLDRKGVILPLTDVVIACCAKRIDATVLTYDHHFDKIPGVRTTDRLDR
jgi:predicted nucleic acid-binding protein